MKNGKKKDKKDTCKIIFLEIFFWLIRDLIIEKEVCRRLFFDTAVICGSFEEIDLFENVLRKIQ